MFHDLRKLKHFVEVARHGHYAGAAQSLGIAQPTLTRSVQALEVQAGGRLLDRGRNGAVPTTLGEELLRRAEVLLKQAADTEREIHLLAGLGAGQVRIGAGAYPADISIGIATARFTLAYPAISTDIAIADWSGLGAMLLRGDIDLAVAEVTAALEDDRLEVEPLPRHRGLWFCRAGHPLLRRGADLSLEDLSAYPFASTSLPPRLERVFASNMPSPAFPLRHRVDTFELIRRIVLHSDALAAGALVQLAADLAAGRIALLPVTLPEVHTAYGIMSLSGRSASPAAAAFAAFLRQVEAEIVAQEHGLSESQP